MKSLIVLWKVVANECATRCHTSATQDLKTVLCRVEHEGFSFLTITLTTFGSDFQKGLDQGWLDRSLFQGFTWRAGLPAFLGGFLDLVFDRSSGVLLDDPSIDAIQSIRQLTLMFGKVALPCTEKRERAAMDSFVQCENDVTAAWSSASPALISQFRQTSRLLFSSAFTAMDREVHDNGVVPKHGPGSTADKLRGNGKYRQLSWPARLEKVFPVSDYLLTSHSYYEMLDDVDIIEPGAEQPVKVISVPKTLKTPRIIAIEPTAMQYMQQGVLEVVLNGLAEDDFLSTIIGFDDQVPNQEMARMGSLSGELATLDLSEASDRVSNQLVREMFGDHVHLYGAVDACRSRKADVPGHGVLTLAKFASMGSALCFPVEAMVFATIIFTGIARELNTPLSRRTLKGLKDKVRIYGDDIIIPVEFVYPVIDVLEAFGLKVNIGKSFWTGRFRESCGKEYYAGQDVSIVKVRNVFPASREDAAGAISIVSLRNQLYYAGYWSTCKWLDEHIRGVLRYFPVVLPSSPVLGRHSYLGFETQRVGVHLQNPLVRGYKVSSVPPSDLLDGHGALLKFFLKRGQLPSADRKHLERSGRPHAVNIKLGWNSAI